jgi:uncharacterized protein (DUF342 family)
MIIVNQFDGFMELETRADGIYIVIYAPMGSGEKVTLESATRFVESKGLKQYDKNLLMSALETNNEKEEVKISNLTVLPAVDEEMNIEISKNKMFVVICFVEPQNGGKTLTKEQISSKLKDKGIIYGIDELAIDELVKKKRYNYKYLIAKGTEPINGKNGVLDFKFDIEKKNIKPKITEDGSVDFRNLDLIEIAKVGQLLVTALPPDAGVEGKNVFGEAIPNVKGKKANLPKGKNVSLSADGESLIADIDGQITYANNKVSIYATYDVPANVDNSTGNIDFLGNVIVRGNVLTGFSIHAGGNIEVYGVVEGADLVAGGDIILYRGMQGGNRGTLHAQGSITSKFIENSIISAQEDIKASAIMHSEVKCGGSVSVDGKKGLLVGGIVRAGVEVSAKTIGSPMATATQVEVGIDPEVVEKYRSLKTDIEKYKDEQQKMNQVIDMLTMMKKTGKITPDKEEMLGKTLKSKLFLENKLNSMLSEFEILEQRVLDKQEGRIKAFSVIYPGVKVVIGSIYTYVNEEKKFCTVIAEHAEIKFAAYS